MKKDTDISREVLDKGISVFDTEEKFYAWLNRPNMALGGIMPLSLLKSKNGRDKVIDDLGRIETGVYY